MKRILQIGFVLVVIAGVIIYLNMGSSLTTSELPELEETLLDGSPFNIQSLSGNIVLIDFWGSWCGPCRRENPKLAALYDKYHGRRFNEALGFEIVSIAIEKNDKQVRKIIEKDGLSWPYHIIKVSKLLLGSKLARDFGVGDLPAKFLYDHSGNLVLKNPTVSEINTYLQAQLVD